jgi:hypothetical protein
LKAILLLILLVLLAEPASSEERAQCIGSHLTQATESNPSPEILELSDRLEENIQDCKTTECVQSALGETKGRLRKALESTCIGRQKAAMNALMIRLAVNEGSWIATWLIPAIAEKNFPIEYVAANLVLLPILINKSCINTFERGIPGEPPVGWKQADWGYTKTAMASNIGVLGKVTVGVVAANVLLDIFYRHKKEKPSEYAAKGLLLAFEQMTLSNYLNVKYFDPFLKVELPKLGELASGGVLQGVKNPKPLIMSAGVAGAFVSKTIDFSILNAYMKLTQIPTEKLLQMSWEEIESVIKKAAECKPSDQACDVTHAKDQKH